MAEGERKFEGVLIVEYYRLQNTGKNYIFLVYSVYFYGTILAVVIKVRHSRGGGNPVSQTE
jgi:hypothetical protein